jgi:chaperonin cofactor prefoldin
MAVEKRQEELEKVIAELQKQNKDLKKEVETLQNTPPAAPPAADKQNIVTGFNK